MIDLRQYEPGKEYEHFVTTYSADTKTDEQVRQLLLQALYNIYRAQPTRAKYEQIDVEGFCNILGISKSAYQFNATVLIDKGYVSESPIQQLSISEGGIYISPTGIDKVEAVAQSGFGTYSEILALIAQLEQRTPGQYVVDKIIAQESGLEIQDVRDWIDVLETEGLVKTANSRDGHSAVLTAKGKLLLKGDPTDAKRKLDSDLTISYLRSRINRLREDPSRGQITISIPGNFNTFTVKQLDELIAAVSTAANVDPEEVFVRDIRSGSVNVTLELSQHAAQKFVNELKKNHPDLEPFSITIEHKFQRKQQQNNNGRNIILCLAAEPIDAVWLQLGREYKEIFESVNRAIYGSYFTPLQIPVAKVKDVLRYLLYYRPIIVHFSGHGAENGALLFEDSQGVCQSVEPHALSELFKGLKGDTRCVVLNSCYSDMQAEQISRHVDCVVGIEGEIENTSALAFAAAFYEAIASGRSVEAAYIPECL